MKYKIRPGVKLVECCGEFLLISTYESRTYCPYIMALNEASAFIWNKLEEEMDIKDIAGMAAENYDISYELAYSTVCQFLEMIEVNGYILESVK